jgi:hypothetical protein
MSKEGVIRTRKDAAIAGLVVGMEIFLEMKREKNKRCEHCGNQAVLEDGLCEPCFARWFNDV